MKQNNDIPDKIMERIRKLMRLKESTTSEGEARAAAAAASRLLKEYNLSLFDISGRDQETVFAIGRSGAFSYKDAFGSYWKRDLLNVLCRYNYCRILLCRAQPTCSSSEPMRILPPSPYCTIICARLSAGWQKRGTGNTCPSDADITGPENTERNTYAPISRCHPRIKGTV